MEGQHLFFKNVQIYCGIDYDLGTREATITYIMISIMGQFFPSHYGHLCTYSVV